MLGKENNKADVYACSLRLFRNLVVVVVIVGVVVVDVVCFFEK